MEIIYSKKFQKQAKKLIESRKILKAKINECIFDFSRNVRNSQFYRKSLKGDRIGYEEIQIGGDIRIIVRIRIREDKTIFEEIGTHSQLGL